MSDLERMSLDELDDELQKEDLRTQIMERRKLAAAARQKFGPDWKRMFQKAGGLFSKGSGIDWASLKFRVDQKGDK